MRDGDPGSDDRERIDAELSAVMREASDLALQRGEDPERAANLAAIRFIRGHLKNVRRRVATTTETSSEETTARKGPSEPG